MIASGFLDSAVDRDPGEEMRRVLRVRVAFEVTRCSEEQQQMAYERVVPTVRRACDRPDRESPTAIRAQQARRSAPKKVAS